jgi:hypothetical protein
MAADYIPSGVYFGFTLPELRAELVRYKGEVRQRGSALQGSSVEGSSFSFGSRRDGSLAEWSADLQAALAYFGEAETPRNSQTVTLTGGL